MSDERLREAERKWRETGAVEDEARYLLERVRAGDLTQGRLELAAYCGQPAAETALGRTTKRPRDLAERILELRTSGGYPALLLGLSAAARVALRLWSPSAPLDHARNVLDAVDAWAADPQPPRRNHASSLAGPVLLQFARQVGRENPAAILAKAINAILELLLLDHADSMLSKFPATAATDRLVSLLGEEAWTIAAGRVGQSALQRGL